MGLFDHITMGVAAVFLGPELFSVLGIPVSVSLAMIVVGFFLGIAVGATPGLAGPMAMAISLPILISVFGFSPDALLPVMGFLIGVMKGATIGGAVPAILFNTPGTPDAYMTTLDGYPMTRNGQAGKALRIAHFSSAAGDSFSDVVLIVGAPFLAVLVESYLHLPEKTALLVLSLAFISSVIGKSVGKGLISMGAGLLVAYVGTGEDFYPRLSMGSQALAEGIPIATAVLGVLILGEVFKGIEDQWNAGLSRDRVETTRIRGDQGLKRSDIRRILPVIGRSAVIGTAIGALPGVGSTLAATLGYTINRRRYELVKPEHARSFGSGVPEGVAATEAANSSVSGANLIPVLSLGIPGNAAAVFLILAADSIGGFNPGPTVFRLTTGQINPELVIAFGLFTTMLIANVLNWTIGGLFMRSMGVLVRVPKHILLPVVLLVTLTSIYVQETRMEAVIFAIGFGFLGYLMRRLEMSPLPFVIAFILGGTLEETARQAFAATGRRSVFPAHESDRTGFHRSLSHRGCSGQPQPEQTRESDMNRPNFLIISADQQRADCLGVEGRRIKTPHLDQLATDGTRFSACITPCVVCQPARASILTGQLCRTHGVHDNGIDLDPSVGERGFSGALAGAGYTTAFFGKAHFSTYHTFEPTGTPECIVSSANYSENWNGPYMGFDTVELMLVGHNWFLPEKPPRGHHYERWFYADGRGDVKNALYRESAGDTRNAAQTWHSCLPVAWHNSTWTADRAVNWLRECGASQPFCAWVSFPGPPSSL